MGWPAIAVSIGSFDREKKRVVRLAAVVHLDLEARVGGADRVDDRRRRRSAPSPTSTVRTSAPSADEARDDVRRHGLRGSSPEATGSPSSEPEELPLRHVDVADLAAREARATDPARTPAAASSISATFSSSGRRRRRRRARPSPACRLRVGIDAPSFPLCAAACSAARIDVLGVRQEDDARLGQGLDRGEQVSAVDGFIVSPPSTQDAPRLSKSLRFPAPSTTATAPQTPPPRSRRSVAVRGLDVHVLDVHLLDHPDARWRARARAPGSSVWTCTLTAPGAADDEQRVAELRQLALELVGIDRRRPRRRTRCSSGSARAPDGRPRAGSRSATASSSGSGSPRTWAAIPRRISSSPAPPASTTPACLRMSSCSVVAASAFSPAHDQRRPGRPRPRGRRPRAPPPAPPARGRPSASSPPAGSGRPRSRRRSRLAGCARARPRRSRPRLLPQRPRATSCERMTPELPRAPMRTARTMSASRVALERRPRPRAPSGSCSCPCPRPGPGTRSGRRCGRCSPRARPAPRRASARGPSRRGPPSDTGRRRRSGAEPRSRECGRAGGSG